MKYYNKVNVNVCIISDMRSRGIGILMREHHYPTLCQDGICKDVL